MEKSLKVLEEVKAAVEKFRITIKEEMDESPDPFFLSGLDLAREGMEAHIGRAELVADHHQEAEPDSVYYGIDQCADIKRILEPLVPGRLNFEDEAIRPWLVNTGGE